MRPPAPPNGRAGLPGTGHQSTCQIHKLLHSELGLSHPCLRSSLISRELIPCVERGLGTAWPFEPAQDWHLPTRVLTVPLPSPWSE